MCVFVCAGGIQASWWGWRWWVSCCRSVWWFGNNGRPQWPAQRLHLHDPGLRGQQTHKCCMSFTHLYVSSSLFPLSCHCFLQRSSSSESLSEKGPSELKSFDAVVFDVLKVTPEEYAVSQTSLCVREAFVFVHSSLFTLSDYAGILNGRKQVFLIFFAISWSHGCF